MTKWKPWIAMMTLSLGLVGCGAAGDQTGNSTYNSAGTRSLGNGGTTSWNMSTNMNDQRAAYPGSYANNSVYKDGNGSMGTLSANRNTKDYGYATYSKRDMNQQQASTFYVDRNVLARGVANVITSIPGVEKANVLVTDEDLIITLPGIKDSSILNKAKLSAWSMSPRYYKIHVTGDQQIIDQVHALVNRSPKKLNHAEVNSILKSKKWIDMTGTNVTDNGQNVTDYNLDHTYPNTNAKHRGSNNH